MTSNADADYYRKLREWQSDAQWGGDDELQSNDPMKLPQHVLGIDTLRELEPVHVGSLPARQPEVDRGMELTAIMAVFLCGIAIGLIVGALIWAR